MVRMTRNAIWACYWCHLKRLWLSHKLSTILEAKILDNLLTMREMVNETKAAFIILKSQQLNPGNAWIGSSNNSVTWSRYTQRLAQARHICLKYVRGTHGSEICFLNPFKNQKPWAVQPLDSKMWSAASGLVIWHYQGTLLCLLKSVFFLFDMYYLLSYMCIYLQCDSILVTLQYP